MRISSFLASAIFAICCIFGSSADASIFGGFLSYDGLQDEIRDNSFSLFEDNGAAGISEGDVISGIILVESITASGVGNQPTGFTEQTVVAFAATITGIEGTVGVDAIYTLGSATGTLSSLLTAGIIADAGIDMDTIAVVVSSETGFGDDPNANPANWAASDVATNFGTYGFGWEGTLGVVGGDDFFEARDSVDTNVLFDEAGVFTVQSSQGWGSNLLDVSINDFTDDEAKFGDVTLSGDIFGAGDDPSSNGWFFEDNTTFFINPVPEPGSLAIWSTVMVVCLSSRRRGQKVA